MAQNGISPTSHHLNCPILASIFFLVDEQMLQDITDSTIGTITWSDHLPVTITVGERITGPSRIWRLNTSLLASQGTIQNITDEHHSFFELNDQPYIDQVVLWSTYKVYMRGVLIKLYRKIKRQRTQQIEEILSQTDQLETLNKQIKL